MAHDRFLHDQLMGFLFTIVIPFGTAFLIQLVGVIKHWGSEVAGKPQGTAACEARGPIPANVSR